MTTLEKKRMLKLAGLLKEGVEEWIDETAPDMEKVPHANVDADLDIPMGYAPGEDQSGDDEEEEYKEWLAQSLHTHAGQDLKYLPVIEESLEEAPPPHDPEERKAAGLNPLPKDEKGPFGEELPRGNKFGAQTLKANPGLVELHEIIRSLVRAVLLEKTKK